MNYGIPVLVAAIALATLAILGLPGWDRPPVEPTQIGYRGLGMEEVVNPRTAARQVALNQAPDPLPPAPEGGPPASSVYQNVPVLGDLSVAEFTRAMVAITNWVAPEQGCAYCHGEGGDFASDDLYTKVVSRRMLQMTRHINTDWASHVQQTGVTCYTCHRGQPVPANVWFTDPGPPQAGGMAADRAGQNLAARSVAYASLPLDPLTPFLAQDHDIRVVSTTALPEGNRRSIKQTEWTYGLMMHFSQALGVNCTYCHNSRSFFAWDQSTAARTTAWHGIRMVRELNADYLEPLASVFPPQRLGALGDVPKVNCATCHNGVYKPLFGASMLNGHPELGPVAAASADAAQGAAASEEPGAMPADQPATPPDDDAADAPAAQQ